MVETIKVTGLKETRAKFKAIDRKLDKEFVSDLKAATEPVVDASKRKIGRFAGASLRTIKPRATGRVVSVRQGAKKVTGNRGFFGAQQQKRMSDALSENRDEVVALVRKAVNRTIESAG